MAGRLVCLLLFAFHVAYGLNTLPGSSSTHSQGILSEVNTLFGASSGFRPTPLRPCVSTGVVLDQLRTASTTPACSESKASQHLIALLGGLVQSAETINLAALPKASRDRVLELVEKSVGSAVEPGVPMINLATGPKLDDSGVIRLAGAGCKPLDADSSATIQQWAAGTGCLDSSLDSDPAIKRIIQKLASALIEGRANDHFINLAVASIDASAGLSGDTRFAFVEETEQSAAAATATDSSTDTTGGSFSQMGKNAAAWAKKLGCPNPPFAADFADGTNGCSIPGGWAPYVNTMTDACIIHDSCYHCGAAPGSIAGIRTKLQCDNDFMFNMLRNCQCKYSSKYWDAVQRGWCFIAAGDYTAAVKAFGAHAFKTGTAASCKNCFRKVGIHRLPSCRLT